MKVQVFVIFLCLIFGATLSLAGQEGKTHAPIKSIQADFTQEKHLAILARPIISTGTFTFKAPQSLRWEYISPIKSVLLMHGGEIKKFITRDSQLVEDKGIRLDAMQILLSEISGWLEGEFKDNEMFSVSFPDNKTVLLLPKTESLAAIIKKIELKLATTNALLDSVSIFEGHDSYTKIRFTDRQLNQDIAESVFSQ